MLALSYFAFFTEVVSLLQAMQVKRPCSWNQLIRSCQSRERMTVQRKECVAMILAGGQGSRLGVLTKRVAKPAFPLAEVSIIDFTLSNCTILHGYSWCPHPISTISSQRLYRYGSP